MRSTDRPTGTGESLRDMAARWIREGLDSKKSKPDAWAASMLVALGLNAKSYPHRWLTGEQQVPLQAVAASAESHPEVVEHVARELASLVGMTLRKVETGAEHVDLATVVHECLDVVRQANEGERDGHLSPDDCDRELREWEELDRVSDARKAQLRRIKSERGAVVRAVR